MGTPGGTALNPLDGGGNRGTFLAPSRDLQYSAFKDGLRSPSILFGQVWDKRAGCPRAISREPRAALLRHMHSWTNVFSSFHSESNLAIAFHTFLSFPVF